jgi:hypothetical protein
VILNCEATRPERLSTMMMVAPWWWDGAIDVATERSYGSTTDKKENS